MIEILLQAERALAVGMLDQAEQLYRRAADADPRSAIAVVGLARVALERGDEAGAIDLARRAATIDPDNPAAGRMVDRLEEVRAHRSGERPAPAPAAPPPAAPAPAAPASPAAPARPERPGLVRRLLRRG